METNFLVVATGNNAYRYELKSRFPFFFVVVVVRFIEEKLIANNLFNWCFKLGFCDDIVSKIRFFCKPNEDRFEYLYLHINVIANNYNQ